MIEFKNGWQAFFEKYGLKTEADFYNYADGDIINSNQKRNVTKFVIEDGTENKTFYMKRFFNQHFKDIVFAFKNYRRIMTLGELEWENANFLLKNGIETYQPVCVGVVNRSIGNMCSFVVTEELAGDCLADIVAEKWQDFAVNTQTNILDAIASLAARVHNCGALLPDLYIWHYFIIGEIEGGFKPAIIDLHRMKLRANTNDFIRDLGGLHYSMSDKYFTPQQKEYVIKKYCTIRGLDFTNFSKQVFKRSCKVASRRPEPPY